MVMSVNAFRKERLPYRINAAVICSAWYNIYVKPIAAKGKNFMSIAKKMLVKNGFDVGDFRESDHHDFYLNGKRLEMKGAFPDNKNLKIFTFNQIRQYQNFDHLLLVAFHIDAANTVDFFLLPKANILEYVDKGIFGFQHGGKDSKGRDTCMYSGDLSELAEFRILTETVVK